MPSRTLVADGKTWRVFPSGNVTQYDGDEFGLLFIHDEGDERVVRVTRYSPVGVRAREQSLADLSEADLLRLFGQSQSSVNSPEAGYAP